MVTNRRNAMLEFGEYIEETTIHKSDDLIKGWVKPNVKATADIRLLKNDIEAVSEAKELAMKTMELINMNFNATVGINSVILLGATFGLFKPLTTAVLHNGTTIGLLANSMKGV